MAKLVPDMWQSNDDETSAAFSHIGLLPGTSSKMSCSGWNATYALLVQVLTMRYLDNSQS